MKKLNCFKDISCIWNSNNKKIISCPFFSFQRHGAFVWSRMDPMSEKKFVEYYQRLEEQEKVQTKTSCSSDKAQSPIVVRSNSNISSSKRKDSSNSINTNADKVEMPTVVAKTTVEGKTDTNQTESTQCTEAAIPAATEITSS